MCCCGRNPGTRPLWHSSSRRSGCNWGRRKRPGRSHPTLEAPSEATSGARSRAPLRRGCPKNVEHWQLANPGSGRCSSAPPMWVCSLPPSPPGASSGMEVPCRHGLCASQPPQGHSRHREGAAAPCRAPRRTRSTCSVPAGCACPRGCRPAAKHNWPPCTAPRSPSPRTHLSNGTSPGPRPKSICWWSCPTHGTLQRSARDGTPAGSGFHKTCRECSPMWLNSIRNRAGSGRQGMRPSRGTVSTVQWPLYARAPRQAAQMSTCTAHTSPFPPSSPPLLSNRTAKTTRTTGGRLVFGVDLHCLHDPRGRKRHRPSLWAVPRPPLSGPGLRWPGPDYQLKCLSPMPRLRSRSPLPSRPARAEAASAVWPSAAQPDPRGAGGLCGLCRVLPCQGRALGGPGRITSLNA
mmetsp:Transcript_110050/g.350536  ORF Transcript_110050/g.350536 Transcript_110050/m.350536 type:complete len:405 (+) Transcript_110050:1322-2536(+)